MPTAPLARPYASVSIALHAARQAIVEEWATVDEAVDIAMKAWSCYAERPESANPALRENLYDDIADWMEVMDSYYIA